MLKQIIDIAATESCQSVTPTLTVEPIGVRQSRRLFAVAPEARQGCPGSRSMTANLSRDPGQRRWRFRGDGNIEPWRRGLNDA